MAPDGIIESNWNEVVDNFDDMNLKEELLRGIYAYGFERPSAIQQRAILPCIKQHDVIAQAQSGKFFCWFTFSLFATKFFFAPQRSWNRLVSIQIILWFERKIIFVSPCPVNNTEM